jgi:hypothetical protein
MALWTTTRKGERARERESKAASLCSDRGMERRDGSRAQTAWRDWLGRHDTKVVFVPMKLHKIPGFAGNLLVSRDILHPPRPVSGELFKPGNMESHYMKVSAVACAGKSDSRRLDTSADANSVFMAEGYHLRTVALHHQGVYSILKTLREFISCTKTTGQGKGWAR